MVEVGVSRGVDSVTDIPIYPNINSIGGSMNETIRSAIALAEWGQERFLMTLEYVPDEKLTWTPSSTAKSALRLAAHAGVSNHMFASMLRGQKNEFKSPEELFAFVDKEELKVISRTDAISLIKKSLKDVILSLESVTETALRSTIQTPVSEMPMEKMVFVPGIHMLTHASQIDYLQTIWGDLDPHF